MLSQYTLRLPRVVYSGENALDNLPAVLAQAQASHVAAAPLWTLPSWQAS